MKKFQITKLILIRRVTVKVKHTVVVFLEEVSDSDEVSLRELLSEGFFLLPHLINDSLVVLHVHL